MLYVDLPTRGDIERLSAVRAGACVSIYLPTTPMTQDAQADRIALKNLAGQALDALRSRGTEKAQLAALEEALACWACAARTFPAALVLRPSCDMPSRIQPAALIHPNFQQLESTQ